MGDFSLSEAQVDIALHHAKAKELFREYRNDKSPDALESAIINAEKVIRHAPKSSEESLSMIWMLAHHISQRDGVRDGEPVDLEKSICLFNTWSKEAPDDHFERPFVLCLLAGVLGNRFKYSNNRHDLEEALRLAYQAIDLSALDPSHHLVYLRTVQEQLSRIYKSFEELEILDRLIQARRDVLEESTKRNDAERWQDVDDLERGLFQRFEKTGNVADLREALPLARVACEAMPQDFPRGCNMFSHFSTVLAENYEAGLVPLSGLDESIEILHKAMRMCPPESEDRVGILVNMTNRHREAYERGRDVHLLHLAIEYGKELLSTASSEHPERPNYHQNLAICLRILFEYSGERSLLDEAIQTYRDALASSRLSDEDKAMISSNLAIALQARYETSAAASDIEEAVAKARDAVSWTTAKGRHRAVRLNTLGTSLSCLYGRFKRSQDLNDAIDSAREAYRCAWDKSDYGMYLNNISTKLTSRYETTKVEEDRTESLRLARKAVEVTPSSETLRYAMYTHNLATRIYEEYLLAHDSQPQIEKLEEAIALSRNSLECTPRTHIEWSDYAYWLGWRQMELSKCGTDAEKGWARFDQAIATFKEASTPESASPIQRLRAARIAAIMLMSRERWAEANEFSRQTIALLSQASPRSMSRQDMQFRLSGLSNLSTFAAAASLNSGQQPEEALGLLEMGRGLIAGSLIGSRVDISDLQSVDPELSSEYEEVRDALSRKLDDVRSGDMIRYRQELSQRLTSLEDQIRKLSGLPQFQLQLSGDQLRELASDGPLVCFNVTKFRSDAFIVTTDSIEAVPLPLLLEEDLKKNSRDIIGEARLTRCTLVERNKSNRRLAVILVWLWDVAVKPVLDHLGFRGQPDSSPTDLPRVWWVASGMMGLMPLHAAGSGWDETLGNTASRCISSFVHTLKALAYSRQRARRSTTVASRKILAVHAPNTPEDGWANLNTGPEMAAISNAASRSGIPCTVLEAPTVTTVVEEMRRSAIVHFACHGDPHFSDPSQTSLVLGKDAGTPDGRMTVSQLFDETQEHAELAYLSACCTAQQYSEGLMDEGIHLGSVFQLMGFPAVVATLWEADDGAATEVAEAFYRRLLGSGGAEKGEGQVARCLHDAVGELRGKKLGRRKRKAEDVLAWAPFVHIGI